MQVTKAVLGKLVANAKALATALMALWPGTVVVAAPGANGPFANGSGNMGKCNLALAKNGTQILGVNWLPGRVIVHFAGWQSVAPGAIPAGFGPLALSGLYKKAKGSGTWYYLCNLAPTATPAQIAGAFKAGGWQVAPTATPPAAPTAKSG